MHRTGDQYDYLGIESGICFILHNYENFSTIGNSSSDNTDILLLEVLIGNHY